MISYTHFVHWRKMEKSRLKFFRKYKYVQCMRRWSYISIYLVAEYQFISCWTKITYITQAYMFNLKMGTDTTNHKRKITSASYAADKWAVDYIIRLTSLRSMTQTQWTITTLWCAELLWFSGWFHTRSLNESTQTLSAIIAVLTLFGHDGTKSFKLSIYQKLLKQVK